MTMARIKEERLRQWRLEEQENIKRVSEKVHRLQQLIASGRYTLPLYVRFQTAQQYCTLPVVAVLVTDGIAAVRDSSEQTTIFKYADLVDVVAFDDAAGVPIFLG